MFFVHWPRATVGAVREGWGSLGDARGLAALGAMVALGAVWVSWIARGGGGPREARAPTNGSCAAGAWWVIGFGACVFVLGWLPLVVVRGQIIEARSGCFPLLGTALVWAGVVHAARGWSACLGGGARDERGCWVRAVLAAGTAGLALTLAIGMVGYQGLYRERARADAAQLAELRALAQNPPAGSVFVVRDDEFEPTRTRVQQFDRALHPWFGAWWSASDRIRREYRRDDLHATPWNATNCSPLRELDGSGFTVATPMPELSRGLAHGRPRIPWGRVIALRIDGEGRVRLVGEIELREGVTTRVVRPGLAGVRADAERATFVLEQPDREVASDARDGAQRCCQPCVAASIAAPARVRSVHAPAGPLMTRPMRVRRVARRSGGNSRGLVKSSS